MLKKFLLRYSYYGFTAIRIHALGDSYSCTRTAQAVPGCSADGGSAHDAIGCDRATDPTLT